MGCNGLLWAPKLQCSLRACAWLGCSQALAWEPLWWHHLPLCPPVPAPCPPRLWELVLLVGKLLQGDRWFHCTLCAPRPLQRAPEG